MTLGNVFIQNNATVLGVYGEQINSSSVDLAIGSKLKLVTFGGYNAKSTIAPPVDYRERYNVSLLDAREYDPVIKYTDVDLDEFPEGVWIRPGVGVLCSTESTLSLPKDVVGQVLLKSSRGREFYQSCMAGYFDNGFTGQGTLEIYAPVIPIFFQTGLKIVQMRYDKLTDSNFDYTTQATAKYLNQTGPTGSADAKF